MTIFKILQILLLIALLLVAGSQTVCAQIAQEVYAIFEKGCLSCHGTGGFAAAILLIEDHSTLIEKGAVVPGNPDASELYKRLLGEGGALMPLGGPPLPDAEIETVKSWILSGAPDWATPPPSIDHTVSKTPIYLGDIFTVNINAGTAFDWAKWQFDITFDPAVIEVIGVGEGNFLKMGGGTTTFEGGTIDNAGGSITGISAERQGDAGVSGTGILLQVEFKAESSDETKLTLGSLRFHASTGWSVPVDPYEISLTVEEQPIAGDVNRDGKVNILDLVLIARQLGESVPADSLVDVNSDGIVNIQDLEEVVRHFGNTAAPAVTMGVTESVDPAMIAAWIAQAQLADDGSLVFKQGIANLQNLLDSLIPEETVLLRNYPNPFNPETWIPYRLAAPAEVVLTIYDMNGQIVRRLAVGPQAAGVYQSRSRAVYWDGRNQFGESVASGLYFYTLTAGDFTATRRMVILK